MMLISRSVIFLLLVSVAGCVTETSGGLPPPAPTSERVQAQLDLARGYLEKADISSARQPLIRALEIDPANVEAHVLTGVLYQAEQEHDLAEDHYRQALRIEPNNSLALNNYGAFLYALGRYSDALVPLRRLVQNPAYRARGQAFENLGFALRGVGEDAEAETAFRRAVDLSFTQYRSMLELADFAYERGELREATELLESYRRGAPASSKSLCLGMKLGAAVGNPDQVASNGLALKRLFPEQADRCQVKN